MCKAFLPLLKERKGARIVNLSSVASQLNHYSPEIQQRFRNVKTLDEVDQLASEYLVCTVSLIHLLRLRCAKLEILVRLLSRKAESRSQAGEDLNWPTLSPRL